MSRALLKPSFQSCLVTYVGTCLLIHTGSKKGFSIRDEVKGVKPFEIPLIREGIFLCGKWYFSSSRKEFFLIFTVFSQQV